MKNDIKDWDLVVRRMDKVWMNCNDGNPNILVAMFILSSDAQKWAEQCNVEMAKYRAVYEIEEGSDN